jgi:hypothetical protein
MMEGCFYILLRGRCYKISPSSYLLLSGCPSLLYLNVFGLLRDPALEELKYVDSSDVPSSPPVCWS